MFKALAEAAKRAPIAIMVTTEGDHLRVTIQQKADKLKDGQIPLSISVAQTPELLDAELPAAITEASTTTQCPESVHEQVRKQAARAADGAKNNAEKKASKKKPAAAAPKKAAVKKPKPAAAAKKTPAPKKSPAAKPTKHIASKPTAEQCIAAYHAYAAAHAGEPIKREAFIKGNPTGRRFERLFGNWEKFVEAAMKTGTLGPAGDTKTKPLPLEAPAAGNDGKGPVTGIGYSVYRKNTGDLVGGIVREPGIVPKDGDIITMHDDSEWMVESVEGNRIIAYPWTPPADGKLPGLPESWPFPIPPAQIDIAAEPGSGRTVVTTEGRPLAGNMVIVADTGAEIDIPGHGKHRITDFDDKQIVVEPITQGEPA